MLDNSLTATEQRELLERLRRLQGVGPDGFAPPTSGPDIAFPRSRGPVTYSGVGPKTRAETYSVGDQVAPERLAEAAVTFGAPPRDVTGRGITSSVSMELADLGIMRWDPYRNAIAAMFGDNFSFRWGQDWQSPSIVMYDRNYNVLGIPATGNRIVMAPRRQLWDYPHDNPIYSTILPCDFIRVNGVWYVAAMVTQGLGNEKWTVFWQSRDLVNWQKTNPYLALPHRDDAGHFIGHPGSVMVTFDQIGDYVYIFGTNGLARDRGIWMWRNPVNQFPHGWWEPWGWDGNRWGWGIANENTPILEGRYGELSFRYIQGNCVLSYFDAGEYKQQARTVQNPEDNWRYGANVVDYAFGWDIPQLYGGYISPLSRLNEPNGMHFFVSQWNTHPPHRNDPYKVMLIQDTLWVTGPLDEGPEPVVQSFTLGQDIDVAAAEPDYSAVVPAPPDYGDRNGGQRQASMPMTWHALTQASIPMTSDGLAQASIPITRDAVARVKAGEKVLPYDHSIVPQETGFWCGPAATQVVLNSRGIYVQERDLALSIGTHTGGTDYVGLIERDLDRRVPQAGYMSIYLLNDPPTSAQREQLWRDLVRGIDAGWGVIMNWVAPPSNYPRGVKGSISPRYGGGTVYHYVAAMGYDDTPGARAVWIADSGFWPFGYWCGFDQVATLIPPKGYTYAAAAKAEQTLSAAGLRFIADFEGFSPRLYNDPGGHCTIGYGHLVHRGRCNGNEPEDFKRGITREQGLDLLRRDTKVAERAVNQQVQVVLTQYQFDALVSFVFNVGAGAFGGSTLLRRLNQGDYNAVPAELMRWVNSGGTPLPGLVRRRRAEGVLFSRGAYVVDVPADSDISEAPYAVVDVPADSDISEAPYAVVDVPADSDISEVERNDDRANTIEKPSADQ